MNEDLRGWKLGENEDSVFVRGSFETITLNERAMCYHNATGPSSP